MHPPLGQIDRGDTARDQRTYATAQLDKPAQERMAGAEGRPAEPFPLQLVVIDVHDPFQQVNQVPEVADDGAGAAPTSIGVRAASRSAL